MNVYGYEDHYYYTCEPLRKQHTNLWVLCDFLGVLLLYRRYNLDFCVRII